MHTNKFSLALIASACLATGAASSAFADVTYSGKTVTLIQAPDPRPCTFFQLGGVTVADPAATSSAWFAVPQSHVAHDQLVAFLLTAKAMGNTVLVLTTGAAACTTAAEVDTIRLE